MGGTRLSSALALGSMIGCGVQPEFLCESDTQCVRGSQRGVCELEVGACSFDDGTCPSGRRFGALGAFEQAGQCVAEPSEVEPAAAGDTSDAATSGGGSNPSPTTSGGSGAPDTDPVTASAGTTGNGSTTDGSGGGLSDGNSTGTELASTGVEGGSTTGDSITVTLGEGNADLGGVTRDTFVELDGPDTNYGAHADMHVLGSASGVALLRFRLDALAGVSVLDAQLRLATGGSPSMGNCTVEFYPVLESWTEGRLDGEPGPASWNLRNATDGWTSPGVGPGSRSTTSIATLEGPEPENVYDLPIPVELVQAWVDGDMTNAGLAILTETEACYGWFMTSEASNPDERPLLTVTYR